MFGGGGARGVTMTKSKLPLSHLPQAVSLSCNITHCNQDMMDPFQESKTLKAALNILRTSPASDAEQVRVVTPVLLLCFL